MKIKTCGLFREEDINYANELKPDYIGFVFAESKRKVGVEKAYNLKNKLDKEIKSVGVFVNDNLDFILNLIREKIIDIIQLHGNEDNNFLDNLKTKTNAKIIKFIPVENADSILNSLNIFSDFILLDNLKGGVGKNFNWNYLKEAFESNKNFSEVFNKKYFLAGGLNKENINEALKFNPYCVDLSGGLETDGIKDYDKMKYIINITKNYKNYGEEKYE
ncbi:phosphoribosylanthranilate isomerase [Brachyspira sp.]|uniref:phosphoribosylanthranilate isomerase n=1 Tax=Brachyspira sp. TaxID=1977261 RepID=UPI003D7CC40D